MQAVFVEDFCSFFSSPIMHLSHVSRYMDDVLQSSAKGKALFASAGL